MRAALVILALTHVAYADDELCRRKPHGAPIDIDLKDANIRDVLVFVAADRVNLVVSDEVTGKVTLTLKRVPWDQALCVVAATHHLAVTVDGNILVITKRT